MLKHSNGATCQGGVLPGKRCSHSSTGLLVKETRIGNISIDICRTDRRTFLKRAGAGQTACTAYSHFKMQSLAQNVSAGAVVETPAGKVRGLVNNGINAFKGIQYGAPIGGKMRFMPPAKPVPWTGVRDTFKFGHQSPQNMRYTDVLAPQADPTIEGYDEDCLYLNVWTPDPNAGRKRPVMFWRHGGGFFQESGIWPWVYGDWLSRRGDVVVTINHRLNVLGYCQLGDVGGEKYAVSGNAGILDLVQGLQWVHDNIEAFGGDPGKVMILGESSGGAKVCSLLTMPAAKGLFHRAAIQSGASLRANARVIDTYKKAHPGMSPSDIYFLAGTDRGMQIDAIRLTERKYSQRKAPVYMYLFAWRSPALGGRMGAPHTVEIPFVFDNTHFPKVMTNGRPKEKALAAKTSEAWIQFARSGNPNHKGLPNWPAYTTGERTTMVFDNA